MINAARELLRMFVIGFLAGVTVSVIALAFHDSLLTEQIRQQDAVGNRLTRDLLAQKREGRRKDSVQKSLTAEAVRLSAKVKDRPTPTPTFSVTPVVVPDSGSVYVIPKDSTTMVIVTRRNDAKSFPVPKFLLDHVHSLTALLTQYDSAWTAEYSARTFATDTLVPDLKRQLVTADSIIGSQRRSIDLRDQASRPRCSRKCGIAIGALAVIGTAIAIDKVRELTKPRDRHALHVAAFHMRF